MTRADLTEEVSRASGIAGKESDIIVVTMLDSIVRTLRSGGRVEIRGFGTFATRQREPRVARNPKTGAPVEVPAKNVPFFKPGKELQKSVNPAPVSTPPLAADVAASEQTS